MKQVAALFDHLANRVSCRISEQTRSRRSCTERQRHATCWWRKKYFLFRLSCCQFVIFAIQLRGALFCFFHSVLCGSSVNGSWPAACIFSGTVHADELRWRSVGLCIVLSWEDQQKSEWINFIMRPFQRQQQKKAAFPTTFWPLRARDRSDMCRRRYRGGQKGFLIKENSLSWRPGMILW